MNRPAEKAALDYWYCLGLASALIPTRADASSVAYRRWLKGKGITYGTMERAA